MSQKLSLICGDGGIKGGFIAGAVSALLERFPTEIANVDVIHASSASVGSMCYFLSHGLKHPGRNIWINELSSRDFIRYDSVASFYKKRPVYDIDYLVDVVFHKKNPLNQPSIFGSNTELIIPVQNYDSRTLEYFSNRPDGEIDIRGKIFKTHDMRELDIYNVIRAANSAPFVWDKSVKINNTRYIDAATLEPFCLHHPSLLHTKKILIVTKSNFSFKRDLSYYLTGSLWPIAVSPFKADSFSAEIYFQYARKPRIMKDLLGEAKQMEKENQLCFIAPKRRIGSTLDNSLSTLSDNFRHGEEVVAGMTGELSGFLTTI